MRESAELQLNRRAEGIVLAEDMDLFAHHACRHRRDVLGLTRLGRREITSG